jgi:hypothetical protein
MRTRLDQIEARLQTLIESSINLLARGDAQHRLAHQLVEAAFENISSDPDGRAAGPDVFTIYLHPESLEYWQTHSGQIAEISQGLQEAAREYGIYFPSQPLLRLAPDPRLEVEGIRVVASDQGHLHGQTAAFAPIPTPTPQGAIPRNAFLIIDGNRVFPLNRMVINIGRRPDNHLVLPDPRVSRSHAQIRAIRGQYVLFDLNSTGGTIVNGRRINQCALKPGDVISLSGVPLIYGEDSAGDEETNEMGFTRSIPTPDGEPPEIIE